MKRALSFLLALVLCLSVLSGCAVRQTRHVVELNNENLWKYLSVSLTTDFVDAESEAPLACSIRGVLDYALYEDVVLTFEVVYYKPETPTVSDQKSYTVAIALNAAGDAEFEIPYHGLVQIKNGVGQVRDYGSSTELYWFKRSLRLNSVSGTVTYTV